MDLGPLIFGGAPIGGLYAPVSDEAAAGTLAAAWDAALHRAPPGGDGRRCGARTPEEIAADISYLSMHIPDELNRVRQR